MRVREKYVKDIIQNIFIPEENVGNQREDSPLAKRMRDDRWENHGRFKEVAIKLSNADKEQERSR